MNHFRTTLPDGRLAITTLPANISPGSPQQRRLIDKTMFELSRTDLTPPDGLTNEEIAEWRVNSHFDDYTDLIPLICRECDDSELPTDRYFRDAWEDQTTAVIVNMPKARIIHMTRIRKVRDQELASLDVPYLKALESGDGPEQQRIAALKQALRDIPQTFDLAKYRAPNTLKAAWPPELTAVS